ncbi:MULTISPECIES: colicin D domain-containing protein [unclassified Nocardia]|uniref:colicin D domain-containing protein n=1 Tax=unclassified Nocardia TaxID=2637762 RepID=UPI0024A7DCC1|nr:MULTISPECIES: colicin D domain-containing protein [unclassified Nocardia]
MTLEWNNDHPQWSDGSRAIPDSRWPGGFGYPRPDTSQPDDALPVPGDGPGDSNDNQHNPAQDHSGDNPSGNQGNDGEQGSGGQPSDDQGGNHQPSPGEGHGEGADSTDPTAPPAEPDSDNETPWWQEEPGFWEGLVPVYGSLRYAIAYFSQGRWGWGIFWLVMAVLDVFLIKDLAVIAFKLVVGLGRLLSEPLLKILPKLGELLLNAIKALGRAIVDLAKGLVDFAKALGGAVAALGKVLLDGAKNIGGAIIEGGKKIWDGIKGIFGRRSGPRLGPGVKTIDPVPLRATDQQLQKKFKHAKDFGVEENWNNKTAAKNFREALQSHLDDPNTLHIDGFYHGDRAILNYNPETGLVVVQSLSGDFITGWRVSPGQTANILERGRLGGN